MTDSAIATLVDPLAAELSRSVVVNDPAMQMLYASAHFGDEDPVRVRTLLHHGAEARARGHVLAQGVSEWQVSGGIPADDELGMHARVCWPVRFEGALLGLLIVVDADGTLTGAERSRVDEVTRQLAFALHSENRAAAQSSAEVAAREDEGAVLDLVSADESVRRRGVAVLGRSGRAAGFAHLCTVRVCVVPTASATRHHREVALRTALSRRSPAEGTTLAAAVDGGEATVLVGLPAPTAALASDLVSALTERAAELGNGRFGVVAGIGALGAGLEHAVRSHAQADIALRAARLGLGGPVVSWSSLGAHGPVLAIPPETLDERILPEELRRLREVDRDGLLTDTVRAYLTAAGNGPAAAGELHVHRTTLYYRLGRVAELTGLDLTDGGTRAALQTGFAVADVLDRIAR